MRTLAVAALAASFAAGPPATFVDRSGDAAGGDISTVTVDASAGAFHFATAVSPDTDSLRLWFDTDANAATGDGGFEIRLTVVDVDGDVETSFERWRAGLGLWVDAPAPARVDAQVFSAFTVVVPRIDIGEPTTFRFALLAGGYGVDGARAFDRAPDAGAYRFTARSRSIVPGRSIGGIGLGTTPGDVRRVLGTPDRVFVQRGGRLEGYRWQGMTVRYRTSARGTLASVSVATTNRFDHTVRGVGVGSSVDDVRRLVAGARCEIRRARGACTSSSGRSITRFAIARGRVTTVTLAAAHLTLG